MLKTRRIQWTGAIIFILLLGLLFRLAEIQLFFTESFSKLDINLIQESVRQRTEEVVISDGRGEFLDRNGEALLTKEEPAVIIFPFLQYDLPHLKQTASILEMEEDELKSQLTETKKPLILKDDMTKKKLKDINDMKYSGVYGVYMKEKDKKRLALHTLGFTSENPELLRKRYPDKKELSIRTEIGTFGLESTFDEFLLPEQDTKLLYHVDGRGNPLFGMDVKYTAEAHSFYPLQVQTTMDEDMQREMENVLKAQGVEKGGAVLLDIQNSSVLAMASVPNVTSKNRHEARNYMLTAMAPGSVFKTVVLAAAIEKNLNQPQTMYDCRKNLYGEPEGKQEVLNLSESFAQSCNYTFATLAEQLIQTDDQILEKTASKLGLVDRAGWEGDVYHKQQFKQFDREETGSVWGDKRDKHVKKAIAQTAIGQKNVKTTPLQIANMMATIARGGERKEVRIADKVMYQNGTTMLSFQNKRPDGDSIDRYTAQTLQKYLRQVVTSDKGTGRRFQDLPFHIAGKSGTAQTGTKDKQGNPLYHKWFAGYFPAEKPKYALVVVHLDEASGRAKTNEAFYDIVKKVNEIEKKQT
ncbi:penicillin-binding protein 2 [Bacillus sp. FSL R5-0820]|uniref:peptidoglycan D,D-transpeptidase FtsI family protein n=1 Tax=Bacillus TaxID=1386 RepID=UPI00234D862F|nr:penicillin-binding protein 2 [Bacillus altitudinis]MDC7795104.1 penicillin-binding protein 2 [Bacillus altitudinis]